jgi:predicted RNA polymerase sigma factor
MTHEERQAYLREAIPTRDLRAPADHFQDGYHWHQRWVAEGMPETPEPWLARVGRVLAILAFIALLIGSAVYDSGDVATERECDPGMIARGGC